MTAVTVGITPTEKQQQQKCKQSHIHRNRSLIVAIKYACAKYFFCRLFKMMGDNEDRCHFTEAWLRGQEFKPIRVSHQILKRLFNFLSKVFPIHVSAVRIYYERSIKCSNYLKNIREH